MFWGKNRGLQTIIKISIIFTGGNELMDELPYKLTGNFFKFYKYADL